MTQIVIPLLPKELVGPMLREANKGLMVSFINADLLNRVNLDVRWSYVLYDDLGMFEYAFNEFPSVGVQERLLTATGVRYYSKGLM